ncbi:hypothetical protein EKO27_g1773 [Xylaria grammica]|uniref:Uncharacterized protein n=1 Tax=Xylaria grammica TaxID=363999 RepID=A0A439DFY5_9PEZI|nr:hypothetical protein EKO27_g1773 [Xylaria grammica]
MGLFDSIKQDARSRNFTIYGQGLSPPMRVVVSAIRPIDTCETHMMNVELFILSIATGLSGIQSGVIAFTNGDSSHSWNNLMRAGFYFSFTIINLTSFGFRLIDISLPPSQIGYAIALSCIPAIVSTSTAAAYCLAAFGQRGFVISRTLGGSGIEPVNFTISGLGPGLNSIDGEGSIRL